MRALICGFPPQITLLVPFILIVTCQCLLSLEGNAQDKPHAFLNHNHKPRE